jgi:hypothetical protein
MKNFLFILGFWVISWPILAIQPTNGEQWYVYNGNYRIGSKWGWWFDSQFRMDSDFGRMRQSVLRPGVMYFLDDRTSLTTGYAMVSTDARETERGFLREHRAWQQFLHSDSYGSNLSAIHRLRTEQRFMEQPNLLSDDDLRSIYSSMHRIRLLSRWLYTMIEPEGNRPGLYGAVQSELFVKIKHKQEVFDQNRFMAGGGLVFAQGTRLEFGYLNKMFNPGSREDEMTHIVQFSVLQNLRWE